MPGTYAPPWRRALAPLALPLLAAALASCSDRLSSVPPAHPRLLLTAADSAAFRREMAGSAMPLSDLSTGMVLQEGDGFEVVLASRECAAQGNTITLTSPESEVLTTNGCAEPLQRSWSFPGPYAAGTAIAFSFHSGYTQGPGGIRVSGAYPRWTVSFEDGYDNDFNDVVLTVTAQGGVSIRIVEVKTTGPGNSFTLNEGEASITVTAEVRPSTLADRITWEVVDHPGDQVNAVTPRSLDTGGSITWDVPRQNINRRRWPAHPGTLQQKSLAFDVRASVVDDEGQTHTSEADTVKQDTIDTVREEYVEFRLARVPARSEFSAVAPGFPGLNAGDYSVAILQPHFMAELGELETEWSHDWQVNTVYRNPVHNIQHIPANEGASPRSWHQYGCAADLQTFPVPRDTPEKVAQAETFWHDLAQLADSLGFDVEPRGRSGVGHVHVELGC